jgi:hypothetical protein
LDRKRARQLLTQALRAAQQLGMNQLYDDVIAARAVLPREPEPAPVPPALSDPGEPGAACSAARASTGPFVSSRSPST